MVFWPSWQRLDAETYPYVIDMRRFYEQDHRRHCYLVHTSINIHQIAAIMLQHEPAYTVCSAAKSVSTTFELSDVQPIFELKHRTHSAFDSSNLLSERADAAPVALTQSAVHVARHTPLIATSDEQRCWAWFF